MKMRDLTRLNGVDWWEIDQAEELGFLTTEKRKPPTGRPSEWAILPTVGENVSRNRPTKPLPSRDLLGRRISSREWDFAFWYALGDFGPDTGPFDFKRRGWSAYMKAYSSCHSKAAARSSASRLLKRPEVKAAVAWQFAKLDRLPEIHRFYPWTAPEVWDTLHRLDSQRARWAPRHIRERWILAGLRAKETPPIFE